MQLPRYTAGTCARAACTIGFQQHLSAVAGLTPACRYGMTGLRSACLKVVIASINLDNVCHHMLLAHDHKCSELSQVRAVTWHECICTMCQSGIGAGIPQACIV